MGRKLLVMSTLLFAAACSQKKDSMSDELKQDLDVAASSDGLALASNKAGTQQLVSAIEQAPPAPKRKTASQRAVRHRRAESETAPVETETSSPLEQAEGQDVADASAAPVEIEPVTAPRPTAIMVSMPGRSGGGRMGSGMGVGIEIGSMIGVVLRGGSVGDDHCEPAGRRTGSPIRIGINNRIPVIRGTFPSN